METFHNFSITLRLAALEVTKEIILQKLKIMNNRRYGQDYLEAFDRE
jgi:hypothetical protein